MLAGSLFPQLAKMAETVLIMTEDEKLARIRGRTANIRRYRRLLKTELTDLEHNFILKRLSEEEEAL